MPLSEDPSSDPTPMIHFSEVEKHKTVDDCWCVINGKAYDFTEFAPEHPGGAGVVTELAGKDATKDFLHAHPEDIMTLTLGKKGIAASFRGIVDPASIPLPQPKKKQKASENDDLIVGPNDAPPLEAVLNLHDFEAIAQRVMVATGRKQAWDYYSSGADDELTYNENVCAFQRIWLKPRILVDVKNVDVSCTILGSQSSFPVYLSAVAMCGMGHPDGECAWAKAAGNEETIFMVPNLNSKGFDKIINSRVDPEQPLWFQIYVNPDRNIVLDQMRACEAAGITSLCITVDSAVAGKRERDLRNKIKRQLNQIKAAKSASKGSKSRKAGSYANRDPALNWEDVAWFQLNTSMKIVIKGVQTGLDAVQAAKAGCHAIILSNHGGRNLDSSRSGIEVLPEVMRDLRAAGLDKSIDVFVDGGIRRGTDVLKAIALGAKAVGLGKPAVFAMSAYGQEGIERMLQILRDELIMAMRLIGVTSLAQLTPAHVNSIDLERHFRAISIPASPYVYVAPEVGVRSPVYPENQTAQDIKDNIKALQKQLKELENPEKSKFSFENLYTFYALMKIMIITILKTSFAPTAGKMLHRSGLFMLAFLVVHMLGNLSVFFGPNTFNSYGYKISSNPGIKIVEGYMLITAIIHILTASYFTANKRKFIKKKPFANGKLAITGTILTIFIVLHLKAFRFGNAKLVRAPDGNMMKDLYTLQLELFSDPIQVVFYLVSLGAVAIHLWFGWNKAVLKMDISKAMRVPFTILGHVLIWPLIGGFAICPVYMYLIQQPVVVSTFSPLGNFFKSSVVSSIASGGGGGAGYGYDL